MAAHGIHAWALSQFSLEWLHTTSGKRNAVERHFRTLKERLRGFYNDLNAKARGILAIKAMAQILAYDYNHLRAHQTIRAPPLGR